MPGFMSGFFFLKGEIMKCPYCNEELALPNYAWMNVDTYKSRRTAVSLCCNKPVVLYGYTKYYAEQYIGESDIDDWGTPIIKGNTNGKK